MSHGRAGVLVAMLGAFPIGAARAEAPIEYLINETFNTQPCFTSLPPGESPIFAFSPTATDAEVDDPNASVDTQFIPAESGGSIFVVVDGLGIVRNTAAMSSPTYSGPALGPDPAGQRGGLLHMQLDSLGLPNRGGALYSYEHGGVVAQQGETLFVTFDFYKGTHDQLIEFTIPTNPFNPNAQGIRHYMGGDFSDAGITFESFAAEFGDPDLNEGLIMPSRMFLDPASPDYCVSPKAIPEHGWFTLGILFTTDQRRSVWIRDRETEVATVTPMRTSGTYAGLRMFSEFGYGLEQGWAQVFPGTDDDPATPNLIEGYGVALNPTTVPNPEIGRELDANGNMTSPTRFHWANGLNAWLIRTQAGSGDWWADNYVVRRRVVDPPPAGADITRDGAIDRFDLALLLSSWGDRGSTVLDLDGDGVVGGGDLTVMLAAWGR